MCGIVGFFGAGQLADPTEAGRNRLVLEMAKRIEHRGPDAFGAWSNPENHITLGHRRLSIIDTSEAGAQPMESPSGRFVMIFNGEVFNFPSIRDEIEAVEWRGHSDSEVILAAFDNWGIPAAVSKLNGQFAIAVWDRQTRLLHLVRDRLGIKPFFYYQDRGNLIFGSEPGAFHPHPGFAASIDRDALGAYLKYGHVPYPYCIFENTKKVRPGSILTFRTPDATPVEEIYWDAVAVARDGLSNPFSGSDEEGLALLDSHVRSAVSRRMISDVPLGAFLSGGIDSSLVVSVMQELSSSPVQTFTIGFEEKKFDESGYAGDIARHLGTEHHCQILTARDMLDIIPKVPEMYSEPFADASQIPTYLVSRLARSNVTVSLSGDGGDELFAGYSRYYAFLGQQRKYRRIPGFIKPILRSLAASEFANYGQYRKARALEQLGDAALAGYDSKNSFGNWLPNSVRAPVSETALRLGPGADFVHEMMMHDIKRYLVDDILTKVDRASMAVSLEARVPLLDHSSYEFAWTLPMRFKNRDGQSKWALRQLLAKRVPRELFERPKKGFSVPIQAWLADELRPWAEELLRPESIRAEGVLDADEVQGRWQEYVGGERRWGHQLWSLLVFRAWSEGLKSAR